MQELINLVKWAVLSWRLQSTVALVVNPDSQQNYRFLGDEIANLREELKQCKS
jgi:hypothetical protein